MKQKASSLKKNRMLTPGRLIALGFALVILTGAFLLLLPISQNPGISLSPIDALFTATSSVCVTGLITVDTADTYSVFGRTVVALLIQIGGLGVTSIGVFLITLSGKKISMRNRALAKEAMNYSSYKGVVGMLRRVFLVALTFEGIGALLSFLVFSRQYPLKDAVGFSLFHAVSAFNNAGFDIFGGFQSLAAYQDNVPLNLITMALIIFGGLGFFVICEVFQKRSFRRFSLHTKVVLTTTAGLLVGGAVLLYAVVDISWLGAFFASTTARTAGFASFSMASFSSAGLFVMVVLMFIGASPGSTGGGIKTTTFFLILRSTFAYIRNRDCVAFKRRLAPDLARKAFSIALLGVMVVAFSTFAICVAEPHLEFLRILFEVVSGFSTAGLSTGITPSLSLFSKVVLILTMFIGRLGPFLMASIWFKHTGSHISYVEESINVG